MNIKFIKNEDKVIVSGIFYDLSKESKKINEVYNILNNFGAKIEISLIQRLELENRKNFFSENHIDNLKEIVESESITVLIILNKILRHQYVNLMILLPGVNIYTIDELYSLYLGRNLFSEKKRINMYLSFLRGRYEVYDDYLNRISSRKNKIPEKMIEMKDQKTIIEEEIILSNTKLEILNFSKSTDSSNTEEESVVFIGESGVGKSSLINSLKKYDLNQNFSLDMYSFLGIEKKMNSDYVKTTEYNELEILSDQSEIVTQIIWHDLLEASKKSIICIVVDSTRESVFEDVNRYYDNMNKSSTDIQIVVTILSKIDMISNDDIYSLRSVYPYAHFVSSHSNIGIDNLKNDLNTQLSRLKENDFGHSIDRIPLAGKWHESKEENESF